MHLLLGFVARAGCLHALHGGMSGIRDMKTKKWDFRLRPSVIATPRRNNNKYLSMKGQYEKQQKQKEGPNPESARQSHFLIYDGSSPLIPSCCRPNSKEGKNKVAGWPSSSITFALCVMPAYVRVPTYHTGFEEAKSQSPCAFYLRIGWSLV